MTDKSVREQSTMRAYQQAISYGELYGVQRVLYMFYYKFTYLSNKQGAVAKWPKALE